MNMDLTGGTSSAGGNDTNPVAFILDGKLRSYIREMNEKSEW